MGRMLPSFTAAMLLFHALLGCCRLHADECAREHGAACEHADCCREHSHAGDEDEHSNGPCQGGLDCHRLCVYLPPDKAPTDSSDVAVTFDVVAEPTMLFASRVASTVAGPCRSWAEAMPPLRLHLLHQLLLI